jgi:hypothetical protein
MSILMIGYGNEKPEKPFFEGRPGKYSNHGVGEIAAVSHLGSSRESE